MQWEKVPFNFVPISEKYHKKTSLSDSTRDVFYQILKMKRVQEKTSAISLFYTLWREARRSFACRFRGSQKRFPVRRAIFSLQSPFPSHRSISAKPVPFHFS